MSEQKPVTLRWELETDASIDATWALFGDTDRYNRAVGFGFQFTEEPRPDGTVVRKGHAKALGVVNLTWEERPFRYRVPEWFQSTRLFEGGPAERLVTSLNLEARGGRTHITYVIEVYPRSFMARPVVALELKRVTKPKIDAVISIMLSRLAGSSDQYDPLPAPLSRAAEERVLQKVPRIPPPIGERLATLVREAPLYEQARIHPLQAAERWDLKDDQVLDAFLKAVHEGFLELWWDLLCPLCKGSKERVKSLAQLQPQVHCPSCNIVYDGTFPDSVVVSFKPAPDIRDFEVDVACLGSPYRQPHVLAQDRLEPSGTCVLKVKLAEGAYRIRTQPGRESVSLMVREGAPDDPIRLRVQDTFGPSRVTCPPGEVTVTIENYMKQPLEILLEERSMPSGVLTMGRLLERPGAKELLPEQAMMPGMDVHTRKGAVLAVEALDPGAMAEARAQVERANPRAISAAATTLVAVWADFAEAMRVASVLSAAPDLQVALNTGPVAEVTLGERTLPVGSVVEAALGALVGAAQHHAAIPVDRAEAPEVRDAMGLNASLVKVGFALTSGVRVHWIKFEG